MACPPFPPFFRCRGASPVWWRAGHQRRAGAVLWRSGAGGAGGGAGPGVFPRCGCCPGGALWRCPCRRRGGQQPAAPRGACSGACPRTLNAGVKFDGVPPCHGSAGTASVDGAARSAALRSPHGLHSALEACADRCRCSAGPTAGTSALAAALAAAAACAARLSGTAARCQHHPGPARRSRMATTQCSLGPRCGSAGSTIHASAASSTPAGAADGSASKAHVQAKTQTELGWLSSWESIAIS